MAKIPSRKFSTAKKKIASRKFPKSQSKIPSRKFAKGTTRTAPQQSAKALPDRPEDEKVRQDRLAALREQTKALKSASEL